MASTAGEDGVLKLVHPGRNVEIYSKPVTAAEIMRKYPRHSVTRPDVFEYPWVVVRPESVLTLGKVFFVVPNRTIYKLMKSFKEKNQDSPRQIQSPKKLTYQKDQQCQDSLLKNNAGSTPKHLSRVNQSPPTTTCIMCIPSLDQTRDLRTRKQNKVISWPDVVMSKNQNINLKLGEKLKPVTGSRILLRSFDDDDHESTESKRTAEFDGKLLEFRHRKEVTVLKSCLRKPNSPRKSLRLRVSFVLPVEDESSREESKSL